MLNRKDDDALLSGRLLEGKLVFGLMALLAIGIGYVVVTDLILPAFAQIEAAFDAATLAKN
ncbi:hypothetical protein vBEliSR6L_102 [Erythrobacter phage vB_EliS_R6L]|nr:hypothetical protein vBEliSR6L_102 [Erythrobacter phage vB_EliS_R6L]